MANPISSTRRDHHTDINPETTYLDHAGSTIYAKSLIEAFAADMTSNLFGNPHSGSASSQLSSRRVEDTRLKVLKFFSADPEAFDVVFVANATAGIKLVGDAFRDHEQGFRYAYHRDSHTSLCGIRELAISGHVCFETEHDVETWLSKPCELDQSDMKMKLIPSKLNLVAYPAQSNLSGSRLPLSWADNFRNFEGNQGTVYTLLDASSYVSTSPLSLSNASTAPDFTVLSFYKIFGYPPLGCLIIQKAAPKIHSLLQKRKYFGGGTVDMVTCLNGQPPWHMKKTGSMHDHLEDGTIPFTNIIALSHAIDTQGRLYGSMEKVARHCASLALHLYEGLSALTHPNGTSVAHIYTTNNYRNSTTQGPIIAFNIIDASGTYIPKTTVEKAAATKNIQLRTGGMCNPGGIAQHLGWASDEMQKNFQVEGVRCGNEVDVVGGKPTGIIRASLGAMSTVKDVKTFLNFIEETYVQDICCVRNSGTGEID